MTLQLTGPQKAAVVLAQLDQLRADRLLKAMNETEVVSVMAALATLPALDSDAVNKVMTEFSSRAAILLQVGQGGVEVARKLLNERLGAVKATEVLRELVETNQARPFQMLDNIDAQQIVGFIGEEHPQLVAVILAYLSPEQAALVMGCLDDSIRADVSRRLATMGRISAEVIETVGAALERRLSSVSHTGSIVTSEVGGLSSVIAILNQTERSSEKQILADLEETDPELAEAIRNEMFVFDDVVNLDDRTLQRVLRQVAPKDLAVALKGVSDLVREKFLRNLSERAAEDLTDEIELLGPTRLSQVEAAQMRVVRQVRELEAQGEIMLSRGDDEFV